MQTVAFGARRVESYAADGFRRGGRGSCVAVQLGGR
jgi:hypothetical protein